MERYNSYKGYARTFEWTGDYKDETSRDGSGRRHCSIVAIDAVNFHSHAPQFHPNKLSREINKAYIGFKAQEPQRAGLQNSYISMPVATGNWGCGAFQVKLICKCAGIEVLILKITHKL